jgi:hypothetical protein
MRGTAPGRFRISQRRQYAGMFLDLVLAELRGALALLELVFHGSMPFRIAGLFSGRYF